MNVPGDPMPWRTSRRRLPRDFHPALYDARRNLHASGARDASAALVDPAREWAGKILFLAAVCVFLWVGLFHVDQPILERHGFRQTQAALSAYWMREEGFSLAYQTPVLGAPWSIPFEFPLYQLLVAALSALTGAALDPVGRVVSLLASLAVCVPLYRSLRLLEVDRGAAHFANALYLTAPVYLFWSGTFMIEGLALLLTMCAGYYMLRMYRWGATLPDLLLFGAFLTLGLLQKVTTAALPAFVGLAAFGWRALRQVRDVQDLRRSQFRDALRVFGVAAVAFLVGYAWVKYTDAMKARNEFGNFLTSSALSKWNYGTLELRLSKEFLVDVLLQRILVPSSAWGLGLVALGALVVRGAAPAARRAALLGVVLFLVPIAVFANLHFVHDYYQSANLVFVLAAIALGVYAACGVLARRAPLVAPVLMAVVVAGNLYFFHKEYYGLRAAPITAANNQVLKLAAVLKTQAPADRPILIIGLDWSSELPYYGGRKALAVPAWTGLEMDAIRTPQRFLPTAVGAVVSCPGPNVEAQRAAIGVTFPQSRVVAVDACNIYLPQG